MTPYPLLLLSRFARHRGADQANKVGVVAMVGLAVALVGIARHPVAELSQRQLTAPVDIPAVEDRLNGTLKLLWIGSRPCARRVGERKVCVQSVRVLSAKGRRSFGVGLMAWRWCLRTRRR